MAFAASGPGLLRLSFARVHRVLAGCVLSAGAIAPLPSAAAAPAALRLSATTQTLAGIEQYRFLGSRSQERTEDSGVNSTIARIKWSLALTPRLHLRLHQRLELSSAALPFDLPRTGAGITPAPARSLDLHSTWIDQNDLRLDHDIDRLLLDYTTPRSQLLVGRQGIDWGMSVLLPVADVWAAFSPSDLDTSERWGLDALRLITTLGPRWELDTIIADRGTWRDLSIGLRASRYGDAADFYFAPGKYWDRYGLLTGVERPLSNGVVRAEFALLSTTGAAHQARARTTLGADYSAGSDWVFTLEAHWNGDGARRPTSPAAPTSWVGAEGASLLRGETQLIARPYFGAAALYTPRSDLTLRFNTLFNADDRSALSTLSLSHQSGPRTRLEGGAVWGSGDLPSIGPPPAIPTEFGAYGRFFYLNIALQLGGDGLH